MDYTVGGVLVSLLLISSKGFSALEVRISQNPVSVGENVTMELIPPMVIKSGLWSHVEGILMVSGNTVTVFPKYRDRITFNATNWALSLRNVTLADNGSYTVQLIVPNFTVKTTLYVLEPVSDVTVSPNATDLVELNDTVSLACSASGSSLFYRWHNGSSDITASEHVHLSDGNSTLTISRVLRSDSGPLYCSVSNSISNGTSQPVFLNISYGPDNVEISGNPRETVYRAGSDIVLSCLAQSKPQPYFLWAFEGTQLQTKGPELRLNSVHQNQSGNYSCWAHNSVTHRYSSRTTLITIVAPITSVLVNSSTFPIEEKPFTLVCEVNGKRDLFQWLRNGLQLLADNRTAFSKDNRSVTFTPVQRSDDGSYVCVAHNAVSNGTSPVFPLLVNYGPEQPVITGPDKAKSGSRVNFTCSASSQPPSHYSWYFNGTRVANGSEYVTAPLTLANQGAYTCEAFNRVTGRNSTAVKELAVIAPITSVLVNSGKFPIEEKPFTLVCEVNGTQDLFQWLRNGLRLLADNRTAFSKDNRSVTFTPVQRSDDGSYVCVAHNAVSNGTSPVFPLLVNYGPELPVITGPDKAKSGSRVNFTCSASSQPPSHYSWYFNGTLVANGSEYVTAPLILANQGAYTCEAFNRVTGRNSTAVKELAVIAPITSVLVNSNKEFPIDEKPFTLVCKVNGTRDLFQWLRNGLRLLADNRTAFSKDNNSVTFNPVQRSDDGSYQCVAHNAVSNGTSPVFPLLVNYGPEQPVITGPDNAKSGSRVTFTCSASSQPPSHYSWYFNGIRVANGSEYVTAPLTLANQGAYTCEAFNLVTGRNSTAVKELAVIAPITSVLVNSSKFPIEEKPFTLVCEVNGTQDLFHWLRNGLRLLADNRTAFSKDNNSVTFTPVQRSDDGSYQCVAHNAVSNGTSPVFPLLVNYGPEQPVITGPDNAKSGSRVTFTCSASSQPPSHYSWYFNGTRVASGSEYVTAPLTIANQGAYTCEAFNRVTGRNSTTVKELAVVAPITSVLVNSNKESPIDEKPFTLVCEVNVKPDFFQWLRNGLRLLADNRTAFSKDNRSVTFTPVQRSDDGSYQCVAHNAVSNVTSPVFQLLVNYGPEQPVITGPHVAKTGSSVKFTCNASSQPPSHYSWYFNGTRVLKGSEYVTAPLTLANQGAYTCEAFNRVTGRNSTAVKELAVFAPITSVLINSRGGLPIEEKPFTLVCKANVKATYIVWFRNHGQLLEAVNRTAFSKDNSSVTFTPVERSDDGSYQCVAHNAVSNGTSPVFPLLVNYGPDQPVIIGPDKAKTGSRVTFTCSASSQPPSHYSWYFNGTRVANGTKYVTASLTSDDQGAYTCEAFNRVTGGNSTATRELKVQPSSAVLSKGSLFLAALGVSLLQLTNWLSC